MLLRRLLSAAVPLVCSITCELTITIQLDYDGRLIGFKGYFQQFALSALHRPWEKLHPSIQLQEVRVVG